jgi:hypothetical protein
MTANTPHIVFDELAARSTVPLLSIVEVCAGEAVRLGLRRLALVSTRFTMEALFYPTVCERSGLTVITPNDAERTWIHERYVGELLKGDFRGDTRQRLIAIVARLRDEAGVDGVILGGTEHLLLGILRDEVSVAGSLLCALGLRLDDARRDIVTWLDEHPEPSVELLRGIVDAIEQLVGQLAALPPGEDAEAVRRNIVEKLRLLKSWETRERFQCVCGVRLQTGPKTVDRHPFGPAKAGHSDDWRPAEKPRAIATAVPDLQAAPRRWPSPSRRKRRTSRRLADAQQDSALTRSAIFHRRGE